MKGALERVDEIAAFRLGKVKVEQIPPNRLAALAKNGLGSKAPNLTRTPEPKRTAMVTAVVRSLEAAAIDDALDLFAILMQVKLISSAKRATDKDWLSTMPRLEKASRVVTAVWRVLAEELELVEENGTDLDVAAPRRRSARCWLPGTTRSVRSWRCSGSRRRWGPRRAGAGCWPPCRSCLRCPGGG